MKTFSSKGETGSKISTFKVSKSKQWTVYITSNSGHVYNCVDI